MIIDRMENIALYRGVNEDIYQALKAISRYGTENFPTESVIVNDRIRINIGDYITHPLEEAKAEAHRQYIDVMVMISGSEKIYVKSADKLNDITLPYDSEIDALLADSKDDTDLTAVHMEPGMFCVLFPDDAHMPGCIDHESEHVLKLIGKVRV